MKRIYCLHPRCWDVSSFLEFINMKGQIDEELIWDEENPEILFATELINFQLKYYNKFCKLYPKVQIKVMFGREAVEPDFNFFDYAVGFDDNLIFGDRFIRLVPPQELWPNFIFNRENDIKTKEEALQELKNKKGFCNFLYSNPNAHPMRDQLFYAISKYKRVDSLGKHLNNVNRKGTGWGGHAHECRDIKSLYKFSIAAENAAYSGYTSEKVFTSLEAHTVPIYFGNPHIGDDVNTDCIINANDFSCLEDLVAFVKKVDEDDDLWASYISQPWLLDKHLSNNNTRICHYVNSVKKIFENPINEVKRLPVGFHVSYYRENVFKRKSRFAFDRSLLPNWVHRLSSAIR